jgi:hypothetical protein
LLPGSTILWAVRRRVGRPWLGEWLTVAGVVPTVRNNDLLAEPMPALYVPFAQHPTVAVTLVTRGDRTAAAAAAALGVYGVLAHTRSSVASAN